MTPFEWLDAVTATAKRELRTLTHRKGEIVLCWIMPFVWCLIAWGLSGQGMIERSPVAFVDLDQSAHSRKVEQNLDANRSFGLIRYDNKSAAFDAMRDGEVYAVIVVPENYGRDQISGKGGTIAAFLDETRYAVAGSLSGGLATVLSGMSMEQVATGALYAGGGMAAAEYRIKVLGSDMYMLGNPAASYGAFLGSALTPAILSICAILCFVNALIRETQDKTILEWLTQARGSMSAAVLGKLLPHIVVFSLGILWHIALFAGYGGWSVNGSILIWAVAGILMMLGMAGLAVLFTAIAPEWHLALIISSGFSAPALAFSGFSMPLDSMNAFVQAFAHLLPITWFYEAQAQQWVLGSTLQDAQPLLFALSLFFIIPTWLGVPLMRLKCIKRLKEAGHKFVVKKGAWL